mmetsp:Transcript_25912/g.54030  ORF Transcript_25912/g.54030 Transcript_25912/m.54030 type:complete len:223 (-) Transcript_25912:528-1196(-)
MLIHGSQLIEPTVVEGFQFIDIAVGSSGGQTIDGDLIKEEVPKGGVHEFMCHHVLRQNRAGQGMLIRMGNNGIKHHDIDGASIIPVPGHEFQMGRSIKGVTAQGTVIEVQPNIKLAPRAIPALNASLGFERLQNGPDRLISLPGENAVGILTLVTSRDKGRFRATVDRLSWRAFGQVQSVFNELFFVAIFLFEKAISKPSARGPVAIENGNPGQLCGCNTSL